jgi:type IV pilus assembly protein PilV
MFKREKKISIPGHDDKGFTLLESIIAITILSIGLLAMASLTVAIIKGNTLSNNMTTATVLAQDKMENIRKLGYDGAVNETENYGAISGYPLFKRATTVLDDTPYSDMKSVTVTVYWDSNAHSVELKTIIIK